jgi:hypothetical protein
MKDNSIKIGDFILREAGVVEYPDGTMVDFEKAQPLEIGIMREGEQWVVSLITKASVYKLKKGMTEDLEIIGLHFNEFKDAILVHNLLCVQIFKPEKDEVKNDGD